MLQQLQKEFFEALSNIHFTFFQTVFLILVASFIMGLGVMWITPFFNNVYVALSDQKISSKGTLTQMLISEVARPGVNKTPDKKAHVYPFQVALTVKVDDKDMTVYPIGENKYLEYLPEAIKYVDSISTSVPIKMSFRTSAYIDSTNNTFYSLQNRNGIKTVDFSYFKNHPQYNSLTKIRTRWDAIAFTILFSGIILFALLLAVNYSLLYKFIFSLIIITLAIIVSFGYRKIDALLENYALDKDPIRFVLDVDQHYDVETSFQKVKDFVRTHSEN